MSENVDDKRNNLFDFQIVDNLQQMERNQLIRSDFKIPNNIFNFEEEDNIIKQNLEYDHYNYQTKKIEKTQNESKEF